jgi:geranylgeranyl diphosphate synthase type I
MMTDLTKTILPAVEAELQQTVAALDARPTQPFHEMLTYHMGWSGTGAGPQAAGKRIRPTLLLLCAAANKEVSWTSALPAAAAVELIHNFSLIHDDIQDRSDIRRGRPTIWKQWGVAHAINAGDALFILAHVALDRLSDRVSQETALQAGKIVDDACLALCCGQYLDMIYETRTSVTLEDYWPMIAGKTAALLTACTQVGALLGGADESRLELYRSYGHFLGLAFQIHDDYLGIWGDTGQTGKSIESDLVTGKKSFPVLSGLARHGPFAERYARGPIPAEEAPILAEQLAREGIQLLTQETADAMTDKALENLRLAMPQGEAGQALFTLTDQLLERKF